MDEICHNLIHFHLGKYKIDNILGGRCDGKVTDFKIDVLSSVGIARN